MTRLVELHCHPDIPGPDRREAESVDRGTVLRWAYLDELFTAE